MRFDAVLTFTNGAAMPDPVAAPATITFAQLADLRRIVQATAQPPRRILLALDAPAVEAVTVELWAMREPPATIGIQDTHAVAPADRSFYRFASAVVCNGHDLVEVSTAIPNGGIVYVRRTADTLTVPRTMSIAVAP